MKYYVELGFERYSRRFEITEERYDKRVKAKDAYTIGHPTTYVITTKDGEVNFRGNEVKYVAFIREHQTEGDTNGM